MLNLLTASTEFSRLTGNALHPHPRRTALSLSHSHLHDKSLYEVHSEFESFFFRVYVWLAATATVELCRNSWRFPRCPMKGDNDKQPIVPDIRKEQKQLTAAGEGGT